MFLVIGMDRIYICIDLKTFYASVECVERGLDPFKTNLVVADFSRGNGAICLAVSPSLKGMGVKNRCRLYEIPKNICYIRAMPRMKKYMEYSAIIYGIYLKYIDKNDIHVYSIDEAFLDVTGYLKLYKTDCYGIARMIMDEIYRVTGITATSGIGTNLFLAKIALDIIAKYSDNNIGYLDVKRYQELLWHHKPLNDFWQIGIGITRRLNDLGLYDMYDVAHCDKSILYKEFGINARFLIDHSMGLEEVTMKDIKQYRPRSSSISSSQVLLSDYNTLNARKVLIEMINSLCLELVKKRLCTKLISIKIGYSNDEIPSYKFSKSLNQSTDSYSVILDEVLNKYDKDINSKYFVRKIGVCFSKLSEKKEEQLDLFGMAISREKDSRLENAINNIQYKYGKNSILRAISYDEYAMQRKRNQLIGGHNAE